MRRRAGAPSAPPPGGRLATSRAVDRVMFPIAVGQALSSAEVLTLKREFDDDNYLRGLSARDVEPGSRTLAARRLLDHPRTPRLLAGAGLVGAVGLGLSAGHRRRQIVFSALIAGANRLSEMRTPYGRDGADQMASVIAQYRLVSALVDDRQRSDDLFLRAVNVQAGLSYLVSGTAKAFGSRWIQGDALGEILQSEAYGRGPAAAWLRDRPALCRFLTRATIAWEAGFPALYLLPARCAPTALTAVKGFHLAVAATMELPRFVWGFAASHGAVRHVMESRRRVGPLERGVLGVASVVAGGSAMAAHRRRRTALMRRRGLKGSSILGSGADAIEFRVDGPVADAAEGRPIVLLECGLGQAFESWQWVAEELARDHRVIRYHRPGYGLTTTTDEPADVVNRLLAEVDEGASVVVATHSIGALAAAEYVSDPRLKDRVQAVVLVDGTDPTLLGRDRNDRRARGDFLQLQAHTLFAALTGIYAWTPHAVARQAAYEPDIQFAHVEFAYSPSTIRTSVREFMRLDTERATERLRAVPERVVLASGEYADQQATLANSLGARFHRVQDSTHRTIVGDRRHAAVVARVVREVADVG